MGVWRADTSLVSKVVWPPRRPRSDLHIACGVFDIHGRNGDQGPRNDAICSNFRPQVVRLLQKISEDVQCGTELHLPGCKATGELSEGFYVSTPQIVGVGHASGEESNVILMLGARVLVRVSGNFAADSCERLNDLRVVSSSLDKVRDFVIDVLIQHPRQIGFLELENVAGGHAALQIVLQDLLDILLLPHNVLLAYIIEQSVK